MGLTRKEGSPLQRLTLRESPETAGVTGRVNVGGDPDAKETDPTQEEMPQRRAQDRVEFA